MTTSGPTKPDAAPAGPVARLKALVPALVWLPAYRKQWLGADAIAGLTLAAYAIPVSLAYARLAGLPPQAGLYCYLLGGLGYALLGTSRHLAIGPTSAISLVVGVTLAALSDGDVERQAALAATTALLVAGMFGLAWLLRLSVLANFVSESILVGFKAGAAIVIAATQLPKLFGVPGGGDNAFQRVWELVGQLGDTQPATLGLGLAAILLLLAGEKWWPGRPAALAVVIFALAVMSFTPLGHTAIAVGQPLQPGLPQISDLSLDAANYRSLLSLAFACFLLSYVEAISAARTFALKHRYDVDPRQELLGLGAANLLAGLFQGYPVAGGLSQSAVNEQAGARSPIALVFASLTLALVLLFLTDLFRNLPEAVLAAIVLVAVKGLVDFAQFRHLWRVSRLDFHAAAIALVGVLVMGILDGIILAALASLGMLLARTTNPHVACLGRIPGTERFSDLERHPDNERIPGVLAFRTEAALLYFNCDSVFQRVLARVRAQSADLNLVVCDLSTSPYVDFAGARMLDRLHAELAARGIEFHVVDAHGTVRDLLRAAGLERDIGHISRKVSLAELIAQRSSPRLPGPGL